MAENMTHGRTKAGVELTEDALDELAEQAEAGLEVTNLQRRPGRPSMGPATADSLPVRLDPELRKAVDERAAAEHTTASDVVREALRRYLRAG
jgi:hypothetical protein